MSLAAKFFMDNFGQYFIKRTGNDLADAQSVLSKSHAKAVGDGVSRLISGWAIIRPGSAWMRADLKAEGVERNNCLHYSEAWLAECDRWDGQEPRIFLRFENSNLSATQIFLSVDKRFVRICSPGGVETQNWLVQEPKARKS